MDAGRFIVELQSKDPCWLADMDGDPGRTCVIENAKLFGSRKSAEKALDVVRKKYPRNGYKTASIYPVKSIKTPKRPQPNDH